ncbi:MULTISPECIES: DUF6171 family protein [Paenibacillus]|jgi:hypothetical protein|uniref:DUF2769 domain-containing protein n=1 Tax=Paenibacillus borealis TaxID=160799 RepID=A0ABX3HC90_PAEBO|nr:MULTISPECIES: DUF6171 family protein [Paenibacillus]AIQ16928.1 hypothetical protein H70357_09840 [Paenibacillus sp. FSL H7-0357]OMD46693.1 hypothetical protein BSK56_16035 [Paenibacillus borealis]
MSTLSTCKGCREEYKVTDAQIARILASSMFTPDNTASDEVYRERVALCSACPKLQDGVTCTACGCIIPVVAKLKERGCPLPGGGLWSPVTE